MPFRRIRILGMLSLVFAIGATTVLASFDGDPPSPLALRSYTDPDGTVYDIQVHSRDSSTWQTLEPINAQHGPDCSAPPATHPNTSYEGSVYICRNHVMTALNASGYGVIYVTPNRLLDFSSGGTVDFELSTERMSLRDWWDITISPFMDAQALPLLSDLSQGVDLQKPNRNSIVVTTDNGSSVPNLNVVRDGVVTGYGPAPWAGTAFDAGIAPGTNQSATRQPFRITVTQTRVRFERLASATGSAVVFFDQPIAALPWSSGIVQFGHHSYNPTKDGAGVPATWHWDSFNLTPATPVTILPATPRALFSAGSFSWTTPAPAGSYLRFSALCRPRVNGVLATKMTDSGHPEHASSYMVAIPAGATSASITFEDDGWYTTGLGCQAKDAAIWSLQDPGSSAPTATPNPPTATPTAVPPTATPTATATSTPTSTPTATATSTPTSTPATYRCQRRNTNGTWTTVWTTVGGGTCP